jgi:hypothetical protein
VLWPIHPLNTLPERIVDMFDQGRYLKKAEDARYFRYTPLNGWENVELVPANKVHDTADGDLIELRKVMILAVMTEDKSDIDRETVMRQTQLLLKADASTTEAVAELINENAQLKAQIAGLKMQIVPVIRET